MSSRVQMKKRGYFVGAGADRKVVLGFKPSHVKVWNITDGIKSEKSDTMPLLKSVTEAANGDTTYSDHIQLDSDGFTVKAALAVSAKELHYLAEESLSE